MGKPAQASLLGTLWRRAVPSATPGFTYSQGTHKYVGKLGSAQTAEPLPKVQTESEPRGGQENPWPPRRQGAKQLSIVLVYESWGGLRGSNS